MKRITKISRLIAWAFHSQSRSTAHSSILGSNIPQQDSRAQDGNPESIYRLRMQLRMTKKRYFKIQSFAAWKYNC